MRSASVVLLLGIALACTATNSGGGGGGQRVAAPVFSVPQGAVPAGTVVTLSTTTPGATIAYCTGGLACSPAMVGSTVTIDGSTHVRAVATLQGYMDSPVSEATYVVPDGAPHYIGLNLGWVNSDHPDQIFANLAKHARPWTRAGGDVNAPLGSDGWPTIGDLRLGISEGRGQPRVSGYELRFRGKVTSYSGSASLTLSNSSYDGTWTTADVTITDSPAWIEFRGATRNDGSPGLTDLTLMRPGHDPAVDHFNKQFVAATQPVSMFRAMQAGGPGWDQWGIQGAVGVMGNRDTTWSSRQRPGVGYSYNGPAWEEWVLLANLLDKDVWINVPFHVDADYVRKLGYLLRYGSNGTTGEPYTTVTHDPSSWAVGTTAWYPGLKPGRHVFVEFVNELWLLGYGYPNSDEVRTTAAAELAGTDPHHLDWDGQGDRFRWVAWKTVWMSNLLREAWGSELQSTVRVVLPTQGGSGEWEAANLALQYIDHVWGPGSPWDTIDGMANPRQPVSYYVRTVAGSFYIGWSGQESVTNATTAFQSMNGSLSGPTNENNTVKQRMDWGENRAAQWGVTFSCYEGGTEIVSGVPSDWSSWWWSDPRMRMLLDDQMGYFYSKPHAEVWAHFMFLADGILGTSGLALDYAGLASSQRWLAYRDIAGR